LYHNEIEEERLILQGKLEEKLDKISRKNKENLNEIKNKFEDRLMKSLDKFNENYSKVLLKNDKKHRDNVERPILNYEDWYIRHLTEAKKQKEVKKEESNKREMKYLENLETIQHKREILEKDIMDKLKHIEEKRDQNKQNMSHRLHVKGEENRKKYLKLLETKNSYYLDKLQRDKEILEKQFYTIHKAKFRESSFDGGKTNLVEKNILGQLEFEKKMNTFVKQIEHSKTNSIFKLSPKQKKKLYLDLKVKEVEDKKLKEELEKKKREHS